MKYYVYADSRNRPAGTAGNSYTLTLTTPIKNIERVDLVAAKIPNSLYNITHGTNCFSVNSTVYSITPGFYSAIGLASTVAALTGLQVTYLQNQGKLSFSSAAPFTIQPLTAETQAAFGFSAALGPATNIVSTNVINLITEEFVFLDIMELRNRSVIDAKTLVGETYGSTIATSFAMIPLDVMSGQFKTFKETTDYKMSVGFDTPLDSVTRLTVQWLNKDGQPVNFNGLDVNSFVLRFHCSDREIAKEEPDEEVLLKRIQRAVEDAMPPPPPKRSPVLKIAIMGLLILIALFRFVRGRGVAVALQR